MNAQYKYMINSIKFKSPFDLQINNFVLSNAPIKLNIQNISIDLENDFIENYNKEKNIFNSQNLKNKKKFEELQRNVDKQSFLAVIQNEADEINKKEQEEQMKKEKFDQDLAYLIGNKGVDYDRAFQTLQLVNGNFEEALKILGFPSSENWIINVILPTGKMISLN